MHPATKAAINLIHLYQGTFSAVLGRQCRFLPTCSDYACEALASHGLFAGSCLAAGRVCRCGPQPHFIRQLLGQEGKPAHGYDPVPARAP